MIRESDRFCNSQWLPVKLNDKSCSPVLGHTEQPSWVFLCDKISAVVSCQWEKVHLAEESQPWAEVDDVELPEHCSAESDVEQWWCQLYSQYTREQCPPDLVWDWCRLIYPCNGWSVARIFVLMMVTLLLLLQDDISKLRSMKSFQ